MLFFFLGYARGGDQSDKLVEEFYQDLSHKVRTTAGEPTWCPTPNPAGVWDRKEAYEGHDHPE